MIKMNKVEKFRPEIHFSPEKHWINDPNGLVFYKGEYHLFYQYHPQSTVWGPMHWGHAISKDLVTWEEKPIALYPDELGAIFSGSAVVDWNNTSGLQTGEEKVLVAIFTHHGEDNEKQSIAYSNDCGRTWVKYSGNPVIVNPGLKDFRDPKVFWHEGTSQWIMSLACGDHIRFYGSPNLLEWKHLSSFGETYGTHDGVWECPDLLHLQVEGEEEKKWVLIVSLNPGGPNGGSAIQYFTGEFDGRTFVTDQKESDVKWADWGRDFYAAVTWSGVEEPTWVGWMSNWQYANQTPTDEFRGAMSIPRTLSLIKREAEYVLIQRPIELKGENVLERANECLEEIKVDVPSGAYTFEMNLENAPSFTIELGGLKLAFDKRAKEFRIDRTNSGFIDFSEHFASVDVMPLEKVEDMTIIADRTSIEVFINGGSAVMTETFYPVNAISEMTIRSGMGEPINAKQIKVKRISL